MYLNEKGEVSSKQHIIENVFDIFKYDLGINITNISNIKKCLLFENGRFEEFDFNESYKSKSSASVLPSQKGIIVEYRLNLKNERIIFLCDGDNLNFGANFKMDYFSYEELKNLNSCSNDLIKKLDNVISMIMENDISNTQKYFGGKVNGYLN